VDSQAVIFSALEDGVLELRLARPERRNALDEQMIDGLRASLEAAATDDAVRAVVLAGEGSAFCAGADLARFDDQLDGRVLSPTTRSPGRLCPTASRSACSCSRRAPISRAA
jgi:enoyl-CoA hydratase/carnithine racemase